MIPYSVLPDPVVSTTSPEVLPTNVQPVAPANQSQTNRVPLAVGLTLGLLALVVGVLGSVFYQCRRRGGVLGAPPVSPFAVPPVRQDDLQSRLPQGGKRPPQPAPLTGGPVDTGNPPMYSHGSELGPPPSYESPQRMAGEWAWGNNPTISPSMYLGTGSTECNG